MLSALFTASGAPWAAWFFGLLAVCVGLYYRNASAAVNATNSSPEFRAFQSACLLQCPQRRRGSIAPAS